MSPKPSVGRAVHYVSYGTPNGEYRSVCRAATITETELENPELQGETVHLFVTNPGGTYHNLHCRHDEGRAPGTWHWPERVEA